MDGWMINFCISQSLHFVHCSFSLLPWPKVRLQTATYPYAHIIIYILSLPLSRQESHEPQPE